MFTDICKYLVSDSCSMLQDESSEEEVDDFTAGLQVTGLITYSVKHIRGEKNLDKHHRRLIEAIV